MKPEHRISIFRYVSVGDIARVGVHPPNVVAVYHNINNLFALPVGYDLVRSNLENFPNSKSMVFRVRVFRYLILTQF